MLFLLPHTREREFLFYPLPPSLWRLSRALKARNTAQGGGGLGWGDLRALTFTRTARAGTTHHWSSRGRPRSAAPRRPAAGNSRGSRDWEQAATIPARCARARARRSRDARPGASGTTQVRDRPGPAPRSARAG